jgi:hypothetical protein
VDAFIAKNADYVFTETARKVQGFYIPNLTVIGVPIYPEAVEPTLTCCRRIKSKVSRTEARNKDCGVKGQMIQLEKRRQNAENIRDKIT